MLKVHEIFKSCQFEGIDIGMPMVFVRFAGCNLKCVFCFGGNTLIQTPKGKKKIKDIKISDEVLSYDGKKVVIDNVKNIFKREVNQKDLLFIKLDRVNQDKIFVTKEHKFLIKKKWVQAKNLKIGDEFTANEYQLWKMKNNNPMFDKKIAMKVGNTQEGSKKGKRTKKQRLNIRNSKLGSKNSRFTGGKRPTYLAFWWRARREALERDSYTCQNCGTKERLEVHHINPYRISKDNSLKNLVTLCKKCHLAVENNLIFHNGIKILDIQEVSDKQMARLGSNRKCFVYNIETTNHNYFAYDVLAHNCDTTYASREKSKYKEMTVTEIVKKINNFGETIGVTLTGGEPFIQETKKIDELIYKLKGKGYFINIETNGIVLPNLKYGKLIDRFSISPKLFTSGNVDSVKIKTLKKYIKKYKHKIFFKFVIGNKGDFLQATNVLRRLALKNYNIPIIVQPNIDEFSAENIETQNTKFLNLLKIVLKDYPGIVKLYKIRIIPQFHKYLFKNKKGV